MCVLLCFLLYSALSRREGFWGISIGSNSSVIISITSSSSSVVVVVTIIIS